MVGERGFEPPTPWSRNLKGQIQVLCMASLRAQKAILFLAQLYRSCTEIRRYPIPVPKLIRKAKPLFGQRKALTTVDSDFQHWRWEIAGKIPDVAR